ncbi:SLC13 family permease [Capnocytophaga sp. oral taxon 878]|uniref:SLC13 family permease n=1 Tax=Capnocytophaga sp. oral taxon 878 TaxID=1316596 RepID=UPI000D036184|nr:SLC13 family permease [Capnocytophaga sp. oral taxon 878]AVM49552.1 SLC13 family permease [Capnocytophaga sp. oral taxon 878]
MYITLIILLISSLFFMSGKVRSDLVAMCVLVFLVLFDILSPEEALSGFSDKVVVMMIGLFVVGGAIFQTGLAKMMSSKILRLAGDSEVKLLVLVMLVTAFIGAFVSNTGTVALMMPIVVSMAMSGSINSSRLLMPMAFASSMGGMMTLIGTPPNLIIDGELVKNGYDKLTFFSFTPVGLVCLLVGMFVLIPITKIFLTKKGEGKTDKSKGGKSLNDLVGEYQLSKNLYRVLVGEHTLFKGMTLKEINLSQRYHISVLEIRRKPASNNPFFKTGTQEVVNADTVIYEGDILYLRGDFEAIEQMNIDNKLNFLDTHHPEQQLSNELHFHDIGIAEVLIMPASKFVNTPISESKLREHYGLNILGIQRQDTYILKNLKDEKMHAGDILLVQGAWEHIAKMDAERSQLVVLGQPLAEASKVTLTHKAPIAALIMIGMVVAMMFDFIPVAPVTAVLIASLLMVITGALRNIEAAYKTINWESIVLIAGMLPMALALEKTGVSALVSQALVGSFGDKSPYVLLAGVYFTTSLMTMFISNTATAVLLAPIAMKTALSLGLQPHAFLFAVAVGASMCFASPFSTPPNALVMSAGRYTFMDYIKVGLPLQIIMGIVMIFVFPLLFPF